MANNLALRLLIQAKDEASAVVNKIRSALKSSQSDTQQFGRGSAAASADVNRLTGSVNSLVGRLTALAGTYLSIQGLKSALTGILSTGGNFETLAAQMNAVTGSFEAGQRATQWVKDFAKNTPFQVDGVTKAFIKLKAFGLDPMDGTLQAIADQTAKLGGDQQVLEGITLALGQAWSKEKLQAEEALQLIERGVPVWELLSQKLGKTGAELQDMASKGELGRKEIKLLIDAIGQSSEGAAQSMMSTWNGLVSNLKDTWAQFLNTIAESGTLDYFKEQLDSLLKKAQEMAADGSLKQWARDISLFFTSTAEIVKGFANSVRVAFNGLQIVFGIVVKGFVDMAAGINEALAAITFGQTSREFEQNAQALRNYSASVADGIREDSQDMQNAWGNLIGKSEDVANSIGNASNAAKENATATEDAASANNHLGEELKNVGTTADEVLKQFSDWSEGTVKGIDDVQAGLKKLSGQELADFKTKLTEAFDAGINKTDELKAALADIDAEQLARAFEELGVKSSQSLQQAADSARSAYETIRDSGVASAGDIQAAFTAYAEKAIAANNGVVDSALELEAAHQGLKVTVTETGEVMVQSYQQAANEVRNNIKLQQELEDRAYAAAVAMEEQARAAEEAAAAAQKEADAKAEAEADKAFRESLRGTRSEPFSQTGKQLYAELSDQSIQKLNDAVERYRRSPGNFFGRDVASTEYIERIMKQLVDEQRRTAQAIGNSKTVVQIDGREIAASIKQAGLTSR